MKDEGGKTSPPISKVKKKTNNLDSFAAMMNRKQKPTGRPDWPPSPPNHQVAVHFISYLFFCFSRFKNFFIVLIILFDILSEFCGKWNVLMTRKRRVPHLNAMQSSQLAHQIVKKTTTKRREGRFYSFDLHLVFVCWCSFIIIIIIISFVFFFDLSGRPWSWLIPIFSLFLILLFFFFKR